MRAYARLCAGLAVMLGSGCAFPLFNMEEQTRPSSLAYRPQVATSIESPSEAPSQRRSNVRITHPRRRSVLDPTPPEPDDESSSGACYSALREANIAFERVRERTPGVRWPVRFKGPVRGVIFAPLEKGDRTHAVLDCRLALTLASWAKDLRRARVRKVEYYSMYRPGARIAGSGGVSGHAHAMAIDAARFELDNGDELSVLDDWQGRRRGEDPCPVRRDERRGSRTLRTVLCNAVDRKLFQVVLTPHYNKAHANHLHLERKPGVDWYFVK